MLEGKYLQFLQNINIYIKIQSYTYFNLIIYTSKFQANQILEDKQQFLKEDKPKHYSKVNKIKKKQTFKYLFVLDH